jgi:hypothetical protein
MSSMLASRSWLRFNTLSLMNANWGVFGVNWGVRSCLTLRIQRIELLRLADSTQRKAADRGEATAVLVDRSREG